MSLEKQVLLETLKMLFLICLPSSPQILGVKQHVAPLLIFSKPWQEGALDLLLCYASVSSFDLEFHG